MQPRQPTLRAARSLPVVPIAFALVVALVPAPPARAEVTTLVAARDNTLFEDAAGALSNGSGNALFCGRTSQNRLRRAVLEFDLAGALPAGATLDSAVLVLQLSNASEATARTLALRRVLAEWGEGASSTTSGTGAPSQAGDATWIHTFYPAGLWSAAGGDLAATTSAATAVTGVGSYAWRGAVLTQDVRDWLAAPGDNHGWALVGEEAASGSARRFESRESPTADQRPHLILHYSTSVPVTPRSWGAVKDLFR